MLTYLQLRLECTCQHVCTIFRYERYKVKRWKLCFPFLTSQAIPLGFLLRECKYTMQDNFKAFSPFTCNSVFVLVTDFILANGHRGWKTEDDLRKHPFWYLQILLWSVFNSPTVPLLLDFKKLFHWSQPLNLCTLPVCFPACSGALVPPIWHYHHVLTKMMLFYLSAC